MQANRALDAALALARNPGLAASMRSRPLPSGIPLLLQILADESEVALSVAQALRLNERSLRFAVEHYVETVMLFAGAEPARVLGVAAGRNSRRNAHPPTLVNALAASRPQSGGLALSLRRPCAYGLARSIVARRRGESASGTRAWEPSTWRRSGRPRLPVYPLRLAWIAYPCRKSGVSIGAERRRARVSAWPLSRWPPLS